MTAPRPFHLLLAWPEQVGHVLWRSLRAWRGVVEVTLVPPEKAAAYLRTKGYYHALYLAPADWRGLPAEVRTRLASAVPLVVFGPEPAEAADRATLSSCLYLPASAPFDEVVALFTMIHQALAEGRSLNDCVAATNGRLALAGGEPAWPGLPQPSAAGQERAINAVDAQGGAAAIGPGATAINIAPGGSYIEQQSVTAGSGIAIGNIVVKGDMVAGDKVVQHAEGDQININRGVPAAGKLEQSAAGDQVNVNRMGGAPTPASSAAKTCPTCGEPVQPGHRFCQGCGRQVDGGK